MPETAAVGRLVTEVGERQLLSMPGLATDFDRLIIVGIDCKNELNLTAIPLH